MGDGMGSLVRHPRTVRYEGVMSIAMNLRSLLRRPGRSEEQPISTASDRLRRSAARRELTDDFDVDALRAAFLDRRTAPSAATARVAEPSD
jgi:hypothetical protein